MVRMNGWNSLYTEIWCSERTKGDGKGKTNKNEMLTTWMPCLSAWVRYTKRLPNTTEVSGAAAAIQKSLGRLLLWRQNKWKFKNLYIGTRLSRIEILDKAVARIDVSSCFSTPPKIKLNVVVRSQFKKLENCSIKMEKSDQFPSILH